MLTIAEAYHDQFAASCRRAEQARRLFPSGVTHDLRFMEPFPPYIDHAKGSHKWTIEGHQVVDYWAGHGSLILGHCPDDLIAAVQQQVAKSTHPGGCHELEIEWGELVRKLVPSVEKLRFTSSGTEATLMALRLVRSATGKPKVLKFTGHFHGWHDFVMPAAYQPYDGSIPPGIPDPVAANTVVIDPNDPARVEEALRNDPDIGAVILEPTGGHWGIVPVRGPFLHALRELCTKYNRILIFDEVITGFRISSGGAQVHFGIKPDLTTMAKILAGGLPGGCLGGRADLMEQIAFRPGKPKLRHPGTYNANPVCAAAGIAALKRVATGEPPRLANEAATTLKRSLNEMFARRGWPWVCYGDFSMLHLLPDYHGPRPNDDDFIPYDGSVQKLDAAKNPKRTFAFRMAMLLNGVDLPGMGLFLTACHTSSDIAKTVQAAERAVEWLRKEGLDGDQN
jgi:glutamate-1-semialdehyde 2,1-aminomutase